MTFFEKLQKYWESGLFGCVGLDSDVEKLPACLNDLPLSKRMFKFNKEIIDATSDLVGVNKPNSAFYEAHGVEGLKALQKTIEYTKDKDILAIDDAKRADIGNTNRGYVDSVFGDLGADAITVNPYFGEEALKPFLDLEDKGIIILCRTSNPGAGEFQDRLVLVTLEELADLMGNDFVVSKQMAEEFGWLVLEGHIAMPSYQYVAIRVSRKWDKRNSNCAIVVGATFPKELGLVRNLVGNLPILIPGIGKQGGEVASTVQAGRDSKKQGMIINNSRAIIFASSGPDFAEAARKKTIEMNKQIAEAQLM